MNSWHLDILLSLAVPALGVLGWPWVRRFGARTSLEIDFALGAAAALALGLAWVQAGAMALGFLDLLKGEWILAWIVAGAILSGLAARSRTTWPECRPDLPVAVVIAGGALLCIYLLMATVPPWYRDSMVYHLALPREFAIHGGYLRPDDNIFASFPLGYESILSTLHAFGAAPDRFPPFNPRLVGVWITGAVALATVGLSRMAGASRQASGWAGVLLLLVPTIVEFGPSSYVEPYLLLLGTLAIACVLKLDQGKESLLFPAGLFAGLAASVKYPGLAIVAILAVLLLVQGLRRGEAEARRAVRRVLVFSSIAALVGCPFYLRNIIERGNPVFPMAFDLFGGRGWDEWRAWAYDVTLSNYGAGRDLVGWLLLPLRLFTWRDLFHGFEGSIGPAVAVGLIGFLVPFGRTGSRRPTALLLAFAACWFAFWALTVQQVRFFLVAVPALLAVGVAASERLAGVLRVPARSAVLVLVLVGAGWALSPIHSLWTRQQTGAWLSGAIDRDRLLSRLLPEFFSFEDELEELVPPDGRVWLVWTREYTYYLRRPYRLDSVFAAYRFEALLDGQGPVSEIAEALSREGFTHVLVHGRFFLVDNNADLVPGRTAKLRARFEELKTRSLLVPQQTWGDLTLYRVSAS